MATSPTRVLKSVRLAAADPDWPRSPSRTGICSWLQSKAWALFIRLYWRSVISRLVLVTPFPPRTGRRAAVEKGRTHVEKNAARLCQVELDGREIHGDLS